MSSFTAPLRLEYLDGRKWKVLEPFEYHVGEEGSGEVIAVPAGFITDFASVPRFFWRVLPPTGPYGKGAVIHDFLYSGQPPSYDRARADAIFLEAMAVVGVNWLTRYTMYAAVRVGGGAVWNHRARALKA